MPKLEYQNYHPGLASIKNAKENHQKLRSDHLPFLTEVPCPKNTSEIKNFKIVSWNVLAIDGENGFAETGFRYNEEDDQTEARQLSVVESLKEIVKNHQPDFIALQEVIQKDTLFKELLQALGEDYGCIKFKREIKEDIQDEAGNAVTRLRIEDDFLDAQGCIIIYNKKKFKPIIPTEIKKARDCTHSELGGSIAKFTSVQDSDLELRLVNVHTKFNEAVTHHETILENFLTGKDSANHKFPILQNKATGSYVVGDFNCSLGQLEATSETLETSEEAFEIPLKNTTTSVSPIGFDEQLYGKENAIQRAYCIDGGFYSVDGKTIRQVFAHQLDPNTGDFYSPEQLQPINIEELPLLQQKEVTRFRQIIRLDPFYRKQKMFDGMTFAEYEAKLHSHFNNPTITVGPARDLNNTEGAGITLTKELRAYFVLADHPDFHISNQKDDSNTTTTFFLISTHKNNVKKLMDEFEIVIQNKFLLELAANINLVETKIAKIKNNNQNDVLEEKFSTLISNEKIAEYKKLFTDAYADVKAGRRIKKAKEITKLLNYFSSEPIKNFLLSISSPQENSSPSYFCGFFSTVGRVLFGNNSRRTPPRPMG